MENEPRFNIERALDRWRKTLEPSPSLRERDIQEIEAHLRDSIQVLEIKGLGTEEAFLVASRRVGSSRELEQEFGKANPRRLWLDRGLWLLLGLLVFEWINACGGTVERHIANTLLADGASVHRAGFLSELAAMFIQVGLVLWSWRWITRRRAPCGRWLSDCLRRPWLVVLALVALNCYRRPLVEGLMGLTTPVADAFLDLAAPWTDLVAGARSPEGTATLVAWQNWGSEVRFLLYWVGFVYLARGYVRMTGGISPACGARVEEKPAEVETPEALALEQLGLSRPEALLLIHRRTDARVTASPSDTARWPQVWAERGLWMLTGTFLARAMWPLQDLFQMAVAFLVSGLFVNGHVAGMLTLTLQALLLWALTVHLWRRITGSEHSFSRVGRLILTHPALSMLGFLGADYALRAVVIWSAPTLSSLISTLYIGGGRAFTYWYTGHQVLWCNIVPVVLVVWLARRRLHEESIESCQPG